MIVCSVLYMLVFECTGARTTVDSGVKVLGCKSGTKELKIHCLVSEDVSYGCLSPCPDLWMHFVLLVSCLMGSADGMQA